MKKKLINQASILAFYLLCSTVSNAQISAGLNFGLFKTTNGSAESHFGFSLSGKKDVNENLRIGANLGYYFTAINVMGKELTSFVMPVTGLMEFSFTENDFSPYIGTDIGIYRMGVSGNGASLTTSNLGVAPTLGANYTISDSFGVNANVKYHFIFTDQASTSAFGVHAGAFFKF